MSHPSSRNVDIQFLGSVIKTGKKERDSGRGVKECDLDYPGPGSDFVTSSSSEVKRMNRPGRGPGKKKERKEYTDRRGH